MQPPSHRLALADNDMAIFLHYQVRANHFAAHFLEQLTSVFDSSGCFYYFLIPDRRFFPSVNVFLRSAKGNGFRKQENLDREKHDRKGQSLSVM